MDGACRQMERQLEEAAAAMWSRLTGALYISPVSLSPSMTSSLHLTLEEPGAA